MSVLKVQRVAVALGVVVTVMPGVVMAQAVGDSARLREFVATYQTALNTHDPTDVAAFFSEDADLVPGNLPALRGRGAIEAWWRTYFERQEPERRGTFEVTSKRFLAPDVALVNLTITSDGAGVGGEALPVRKARGTWLLRRHGGQWLIEAARILPTEGDRVQLIPSLEAAESLRPHLRAFVAAYEDTFDRHDPEALSAFYRDDADIIVRGGPVIHGAQAIREWWRTYFSQPRPWRVLLIIEDIRMLSDNVALLDFTATGATFEATEQLLPVRRARATWVVVREDGEWLIAALRVLPSEDDRVIRESDIRGTPVVGTLTPRGSPGETPERIDVGENCVVDVNQGYRMSGTLSGAVEVDFRILVAGPCGSPPGTFDEEWIAHGEFTGTAAGSAATASFSYVATVTAGGDVEGKVVLGRGLTGELSVRGNFGDGSLSYEGWVSR